MKLYAQGDLVFIRRARVPAGAGPRQPDGARHILALGEASGHSHSVLANRAKMFVADRPASGSLGIGWLKIGPGGAVVEHLGADLATQADHLPVTLDPGVWEVRRQREATDDDEPRIVSD